MRYERIAARDLPIARVVAVWDSIATAGGLSLLWPAVLTITATTVATPPISSATHELMAWLTRYVSEVPQPTLPPAIVRFAAGRGSTKAHYEARALMELADVLVPA